MGFIANVISSDSSEKESSERSTPGSGNCLGHFSDFLGTFLGVLL